MNQPRTFRCAKCKRGCDFQNNVDCGARFTTTGRIRSQRWQYRCKSCGHQGWSRHPDIQRIYRREHTADIDWSRIKMHCKQGKRGKLSMAGRLACEDAMKRDPETYRKIKREADREVIGEMRKGMS